MSNKAHIRIIGDCHGHVDKPVGSKHTPLDVRAEGRTYLNTIKSADHSIQVGDLGFSRDWGIVKGQVDGSRHKILGGNHDDYNWIENHKPQSYLGDFGHWFFSNFHFFFIRGADSVDKHYRTLGMNYWHQEHLNTKQALEAKCSYIEAKPKIMISHDIPFSLYPNFITNDWKIENVNPTATLLDECYENHQPDVWIFGHHHNNSIQQHGKTTFICLNEMCYIDIDKDGRWVDGGIQ